MYPILFEFSFITVYALWFFVTIGFVTGALLFGTITKRLRIRIDLIADHGLFMFIVTLIVARLVFVGMHSELFFYGDGSFFDFFRIWDKGLSFWGALAGWIGSLAYLGYRNNESIVRVVDALTPAVLLGIACGSIGAFFDGANYGAPTELPWGTIFRSANVKYITPIHPTQLYSAVYAGALAYGLYHLVKRLRGRLPGFVMEVGVTVFGALKFFEEFFRGDDTLKILGVRMPQMIALLVCMGGAFLIYQRWTNKRGGDPEGILKTTWMKFRQRKKPNLVEAAVHPAGLQN